MKYSRTTLREIYDRTQGYCHLCHRKLSFSNHGLHGAKGSWHVEHSRPNAKGGSNRLNNLYPACIECNYEKGINNNRNIRNRNGVTRAPYNKKVVQRRKDQNAIGGMIGGGVIGAAFGPVGIFVGSLLGGIAGNEFTDRK